MWLNKYALTELFFQADKVRLCWFHGWFPESLWISVLPLCQCNSSCKSLTWIAISVDNDVIVVYVLIDRSIYLVEVFFLKITQQKFRISTPTFYHLFLVPVLLAKNQPMLQRTDPPLITIHSYFVLNKIQIITLSFLNVRLC